MRKPLDKRAKVSRSVTITTEAPVTLGTSVTGTPNICEMKSALLLSCRLIPLPSVKLEVP